VVLLVGGLDALAVRVGAARQQVGRDVQDHAGGGILSAAAAEESPPGVSYILKGSHTTQDWLRLDGLGVAQDRIAASAGHRRPQSRRLAWTAPPGGAT
jgi:hypothetical protein